MKDEIRRFTEAIGATAPSADCAEMWKVIFKRPNYFLFNHRIMVVKISRSERPFWGVKKERIDLLNSLDDYFLVLLISAREGWFFTKSEINGNINSKKWNLRVADNNYKINFPLPDKNSFFSQANFLKRFGPTDEEM